MIMELLVEPGDWIVLFDPALGEARAGSYPPLPPSRYWLLSRPALPSVVSWLGFVVCLACGTVVAWCHRCHQKSSSTWMMVQPLVSNAWVPFGDLGFE